MIVETTIEWLRAAEELSCNLTPSGVYMLQRLANIQIEIMVSYLVSLDMSTKQGAHVLSSPVHTGTVCGERRTINDHGWSTQLMQSLSSKLFDQSSLVR